MNLQVVGAGLPRTGTASLQMALELLLGGRCYHMREIPGHPFDLGPGWSQALAGESPDWERLLEGYTAGLDWPVSMFWHELSEAHPAALVLLSVRDSAETWWQSADQTILPVARRSLAPGWTEGCALTDLLKRFAGTPHWDDPATLQAAYERHNAQVRQAVPPPRLLEWRAGDGWAPLCRALGALVPDLPFPWANRRADWG